MATVTTPPPSSTTTTTTTSPTLPTTTTTTTSSTTPTTPPSTPTTTTTGTETSNTNPGTPTSNGSSSGNPASSTTNGPSSVTPTQAPVTSVGETTAIGTSNGSVYTSIISVTTVITPGISAPANRSSHGGGSHIGAIVGGAVGGVAVLLILALLIFFCLRKRRKDEFDGNFDPVHVNFGKGGGGGGTLPNIDLREEDHIMSDDGRIRGADDDDGMGGRLGSGVGGGGIITPYAFKPSTPVGGGGIGGQQYQSQEHPQMQQMANLGVAAGGVGASAYGNEKRAMRQYSQTPNSNNTVYPQPTYATSPTHSHLTSSINPNSPNSFLNANSLTPEPYTPGGLSSTSDGSSSVGGGGIYFHPQQHPQSMGMGPSRGPSVLSSSSGNSGGRNAKEMEAMGRVVANPDNGATPVQQGQYGPQQQYGQFQAYLQNGPGPYQQQQQQQQQQPQQQYHHHPSSSQTSQPQTSSPRPGTAVVVHEDGGRVVLRKGAEEGEGEVLLSPEIPPTYDSLPMDVRRDG